MYYLQSRYYDPIVGRFVNADEVIYILLNYTTVSGNLFSYCGNSAICDSDAFGTFSFNSIKDAFKNLISKILSKINNLGKKIGIYYQKGRLIIKTNLIAMAIDAISYAFSRVGTFVFTNVLKILVSWLKTASVRTLKGFWDFFKKYIFKNAKQLIVKLLLFLLAKMVTSAKLDRLKERIAKWAIGDSLFLNFAYNVYSAFSSFGNIIATVVDLLDLKWDQQLSIVI